MLATILLACAQSVFAAPQTLTLNLDDASHVVVSLNYSELEGLQNGNNIITFQDDRYPILDIAGATGFALQKVLVNGRSQEWWGNSWSETLTEDFAGAIIKVTTRELVTKTVTLDVTGAEFVERCYLNDESKYFVNDGISTYDFTSDKLKFSFTFSGNVDVKVWLDDEVQDVTYNVLSDSYTCSVTVTENATLRIDASENKIEPALMNISGVMGIRTIFVDGKLQSGLRDGERKIKLVGQDSSPVRINFMPGTQSSVSLAGVPCEIVDDSVEVTVHSGEELTVSTNVMAEEDRINAIADNPEDVTITTGAQGRVIPLVSGLNFLESTTPRYTVTFADNGKPHLVTVNGEENAQQDENDANVYFVYLTADYYNQLKIVTDASPIPNINVGISNVVDGRRDDGVVYNIFGVRVDCDPEHLEDLASGIYIVNGKKVIVK